MRTDAPQTLQEMLTGQKARGGRSVQEKPSGDFQVFMLPGDSWNLMVQAGEALGLDPATLLSVALNDYISKKVESGALKIDGSRIVVGPQSVARRNT